MSDRRLIEAAFPLKQASLDAVHEKNVRHGHISTLHIWPARRPLAASRAALLATLLPDPGDARSRRDLVRRIGGKIIEEPGPDGRMREKTNGGVLHWGRESDPTAESGIGFFREEIRRAFGGRAPRVLDPFAGGGAIPLEAMRLGCEVVASDINPVAWFILRCTLHYPHLLAGQVRPLPDFALQDRELMEALVKARGTKTSAAVRKVLEAAFGFSAEGGDTKRAAQSQMQMLLSADTDADLAWHLRAWGREVLRRVRHSLADRYPTYAEFEPIKNKRRSQPPDEADGPTRPRQLLEPDADGAVSTVELNREFDRTYLKDKRNPRWVAKPVVAYLWTRTVACAGCRKEVPLLKTRWLCKKDRKRVRLVLVPTEAGVAFDIERDVPRDADAAGTMSDSGATCPSCGVTATMADLRAAGRAGRLGSRMTAVVVAGQRGKEYRLPTDLELGAAEVEEDALQELFADLPFGLPDEPTPSEQSLGMRIPRYGFDTWRKLFTGRQQLVLGTFLQAARSCPNEMNDYTAAWHQAMVAYLACAISKLADYGSAMCSWHNGRETIGHTFARFALPMVWDYCEVNPLSGTSGGFAGMLDWVARYVEHALRLGRGPTPQVVAQSASTPIDHAFDVICTDPPYYDAIPYSDLMDFFHVWLRRILHGLSTDIDAIFADSLGPKWDKENNDGELIDDPARFNGDKDASKRNYEDGMARAFSAFHDVLRDDGRLVIVFANKSPDAWETLVSALIRAGFVVDASWPIQTEMQTRQRSLGSAALASSIWLVCKKRPKAARPGWDNRVLADMQANITERLRGFWDAGIRGPDFVWAATGPALEAFSRHPIVKRSDAPGENLTVTSFLRHVRRMVAAFVVRRLFGDDAADSHELDDPTTYYLLHRSDFGLSPAPAGACILYAVSCNLADSDLAGRLDLLARGGKARSSGADAPQAETKGSEVRLKPWDRRRAKDLGEPASDGQPPPLIDRLHRLMRLWKAADLTGVDAYLEDQALVSHDLFARVVQAVIELADAGSEERATLELIQNHLATQGGTLAPRTGRLI